MITLLITAEGQVTLPTDVLEHLGANSGAQISVEKLPYGRIELCVASAGEISAVFDLLKRENEQLSIEQITEHARQGWAGETDEKNSE